MGIESLEAWGATAFPPRIIPIHINCWCEPAKEHEMASNRNEHAREHISGKREFWILWNPQSAQPPTQTFDTEAEAWEVAEQMAQKNDGHRFFVLKAVGSAAVEKPVTRREIPKSAEA